MFLYNIARALIEMTKINLQEENTKI